MRVYHCIEKRSVFFYFQVRPVLDWPELRDLELERIEREYDTSKSWIENDEYEKRTMLRDFKKPAPRPPPAAPTDLLSSQIAHLK
jgi:hypothetical protein